MTGTEKSASEGYGDKDLIHVRNLLRTKCLAIQLDIGLATLMKTASTRKYTAAKT
jgi:hypothetical protein